MSLYELHARNVRFAIEVDRRMRVLQHARVLGPMFGVARIFLMVLTKLARGAKI